jgi:hypothetical protein
MIVYAADVHAYVQRLVSIVKIVTMLEECITKEQHYAVRFFVGKKDCEKDIHKYKIPCLWWEVFVA